MVEKYTCTLSLSGSGLQRVRVNLYGALLFYLQIAEKPATAEPAQGKRRKGSRNSVVFFVKNVCCAGLLSDTCIHITVD